MAPQGVLIRSTPGESWAWTAVRLAPATDLRDARGYADLTEEQRRTEAVGRERDWLAHQWVPGGSVRFEIRYLSDPPTGEIRCALIGQVHAADPRGAEAAAIALRDRLGRPPPHVRAVPVQEAAEVAGLLAPLGPAPDALAEIRKVIARGPITRWTVRGEQLGLAVPPLGGGGRVSWEPVWSSLARRPRRTMLSVCLEPWSAPAGFTARLTHIAQAYGVLARPGTPDPIWQRPVPPDPFSQYAEGVWADAARRYGERGYRMRISLASEGPAPDGDRLFELAEEVARTVSAPAGPAGGGFPGLPAPPGAAVVRRPPPWEAAAATDNLLGLNRSWLEETYWQGVPAPARQESGQVLGHPGTVRILSDLLDLDEAAAAFRLPYAVPNRPPLFAEWAEPPEPPGPPGAPPGPVEPPPSPLGDLPGYPGAGFGPPYAR
ncbi:hypothetical protein OG552_02305 [Streptomyces sp. NBC_01476]|uniref:hypothetical protein n=1 Tax=Streptomyces sp. NBC_01476 TaxID=2903881 RepID=UPI002E3197AA|nr:hypothetical protein [Streptomyces sp. NBC_01476]